MERVEVNGAGFARFAFGRDGTLAYVPGDTARGTALVWVDREGSASPLIGSRPDLFRWPRLSPGGTQIAVTLGNNNDNQIWVADVARGTLARFTFEGRVNAFPAWTPDGTRISYVSGETTQSLDLFWKRADGSAVAELLLGGDENRRNGSWAPDGRHLAFYDTTVSGRDIRVLPVGDDPEPFLVTPFNERIPMFSPNGLWLAYVSNESGSDEVYVRPYPGPGGKRLVSTEGGTEPQWSRDGRELFYRQGARLMAVPVSAGPDFSAGTPQALFDGYETDRNGITNYDVSQDGQRFLMVQGEAGSLTKIIVAQNWVEELKRLVPTGH